MLSVLFRITDSDYPLVSSNSSYFHVKDSLQLIMNNLLAVVFGARCKGKFSDLIHKSPFVLLTTIISVLIVIDRLIVHI